MGKTGRRQAKWPQGGETEASSNSSPPLRKGRLCFDFRPFSIVITLTVLGPPRCHPAPFKEVLCSGCWECHQLRHCHPSQDGSAAASHRSCPSQAAPADDRSMQSKSGHLVLTGPFRSTAGQCGQPRLSLGLPGHQQPPALSWVPSCPSTADSPKAWYAVTMSSYLLPVRQHKMANTAHG